MQVQGARWLMPALAAGALAVVGLVAETADSMCGYFRPIVVNVKNPSEILQPSQFAFITWDRKARPKRSRCSPVSRGMPRTSAW